MQPPTSICLFFSLLLLSIRCLLVGALTVYFRALSIRPILLLSPCLVCYARLVAASLSATLLYRWLLVSHRHSSTRRHAATLFVSGLSNRSTGILRVGYSSRFCKILFQEHLEFLLQVYIGRNIRYPSSVATARLGHISAYSS
ncbi:hypothetical protein EDC04DRAFT_952758 [Pisolithus marmoratus]|nr:hypothetical protein EDC04DRAFT_952758 [Pisolithus marmoratus]